MFHIPLQEAEMEALEAAEMEEAGLKAAEEAAKAPLPIEGGDSLEKQAENAAKLEGYLDGELEDVFDARHMQE